MKLSPSRTVYVEATNLDEAESVLRTIASLPEGSPLPKAAFMPYVNDIRQQNKLTLFCMDLPGRLRDGTVID